MLVCLTLMYAQVTLVHQWSVNTEQLSVAALPRAYTERQLWHFPQAERLWLLHCRRDASSLTAGTDLGHSLHPSLQKMMLMLQTPGTFGFSLQRPTETLWELLSAALFRSAWAMLYFWCKCRQKSKSKKVAKRQVFVPQSRSTGWFEHELLLLRLLDHIKINH